MGCRKVRNYAGEFQSENGGAEKVLFEERIEVSDTRTDSLGLGVMETSNLMVRVILRQESGGGAEYAGTYA